MNWSEKSLARIVEVDARVNSQACRAFVSLPFDALT